ncbi:MAG: ubiquitin-conjugating enzyme E2 [Candidatus Heimdallarchaeota archaeon]
MRRRSKPAEMDFILAREAQLMYQRAPNFRPVGRVVTRWRGVVPIRGGQSSTVVIDLILPPNFPRDPPICKMISNVTHPAVDPQGNIRLDILAKWKPNYHLYQVVNQLRILLTQRPPVMSVTMPQVEKGPAFDQKPAQVSSTISIPPQFEEQIKDLQDQLQLVRSELKIKDQEVHDLTKLPPQVEQRVKVLETELQYAQSTIRERDEELARLKAKIAVHKVPEMKKVETEALIPTDPTEAEIWRLESEKIAVEELLTSLEDKYHDGEVSLEEYTRLFKRYQKNLYIFRKKLKELKAN